jgi:alpha-mannosidase
MIVQCVWPARFPLTQPGMSELRSTHQCRGRFRLATFATLLLLTAGCRDRRGVSNATAILPGQCDVPLSQWLIAGPFPLDTGTFRLDKQDLGSPSALYPLEGDRVPEHASMEWRRVDADSLGRIDLYSVLPEPNLDNRAVYALTYIRSPEARTIRFAVESDDDVVLWLNGRRVHKHAVARELRTATDTITLTLAAGSNRLLYRVVNRGGGFGLGGRMLFASPELVGDLSAAVDVATRDLAIHTSSGDTLRHPQSAAVTLGPAILTSRARIDARSPNRLIVPVRVCVGRRTSESTPISLALGSTSVPALNADRDVPQIVSVNADWAELARGVLTGHSDIIARRGRTIVGRLPLHITGDALLTLLSRPVYLDDWFAGDGKRSSLPPEPDSATRAYVKRIEADVPIPLVLGGTSLDASVAEFDSAQRISLDGVRARPDSLGRIPLCAPCRAGVHVALSIEPGNAQWWDVPFVRVREPGWAEIRDAASWARYFSGDSSLAVPDSTVAAELLRAALDPAKEGYHAIIAQWLARLAPAAARVRRDTIDLVGHSHIDAAWMWRWREGRDEVEHTWTTVAKLMAKYPDMHFAASSAQYYVWLEQRDPKLLARIQALAHAGRWHPVGGWWVESDANIPSGESLVRQALYGQRTFMRLFGHPSRVAWLPNTFGFAWSLPQILRQSGFEYFVTEEMRWNDTNRWPAKLNTFWWEGPDGSRIFVDMLYAYDHDLTPRRLAKEFDITRDSSASPRMLTVYGVGDHGGGPTMAMLDRERDLRRVPVFPVLRNRSPDSSLSTMRSDARTGPIVRDELYLEFHRGTYTTQAATKRRNRELESLLQSAEAAATMASAPYPRDSLAAAWQLVLFNQFHDILPGTSIDSVYFDAGIDYARAERIARSVVRSSLESLASHLDTRPPNRSGTPFLVFNPSGRVRTDVVRLPASAGTIARDSSGRLLPSSVHDSTLEVLVRDLPALSAAVIFVEHGAAPGATRNQHALALENANVVVAIDPATGNIARLYDKQHGFEALVPGAGALVMLDDQPQRWDAWNIDNLHGARRWLDQRVRVSAATRTPLGQEITVHRERDSASVDERYLLRDDAMRLDVTFTVDWGESHRLLELAVPLAFHVDSTRAEIPYASIGRPTRPVTRRDSARFEVPMQRWVDASHGGHGVSVINDAKYGYNANGDTIFIALLRSPKSPDPQADMGVHAFTVSILPHDGDWRDGAIREAATSLNTPLLALPAAVHNGRGRAVSGIQIESRSVELGALKRAEEGDRTIIRLVETAGRPERVKLRFPFAVDARQTDLLERVVPNGYRSCGAVLSVPMRAFELRTLAIAPARCGDSRAPNSSH